MLDSFFRNKIQSVLIDNLLKKSPMRFVHPNIITSIACLLGLTSALLIYFNHPYIAVVFLLFSGYLDILDGSIARVFQKKTQVGCTLDIFLDRVVEFSILFALFLVDPVKRAIVSMLIAGGVIFCVTSFLVVGVFSENNSEKSFHYSPGIVERAEAFVFFSWMICFPSHFQIVGYIFAFSMMLTSLVRIIEFLKQSKEHSAQPSYEKDE